MTNQFFTLTADAVAHVKGAYAEIVASTPANSSRMFLQCRFSSATGRSYLIDIATGAAASEVVIVSNIAVITDTESIGGVVIPIDVDVPAGTRLSARCQGSTTGSITLACCLLLDTRPIASIANPVTYGADTTVSLGTQVDPGATINTKGAYVQFSASTTARIDALVICITTNAGLQAIASFTSWNVDVATGAAASETVVLPDVTASASSIADTMRPSIVRLPISIPAGTRLAVRCQCNRNTATERLIKVTLIGMQEPASVGGAGAAATVAYVG